MSEFSDSICPLCGERSVTEVDRSKPDDLGRVLVTQYQRHVKGCGPFQMKPQTRALMLRGSGQ